MKLESILNVNSKLINNFSCGQKDLDLFLKKHAYTNDKNGYGKTYLLCNSNNVLGFFTLSAAQISFDEFPLNAKIPKYPLPAIRIARLGVNILFQHKGYGKMLLKEAFLKILEIKDRVGIKLIIVDAKDESISFYQKFGFDFLLTKSNTMYLLLDTLTDAYNK